MLLLGKISKMSKIPNILPWFKKPSPPPNPPKRPALNESRGTYVCSPNAVTLPFCNCKKHIYIIVGYNNLNQFVVRSKEKALEKAEQERLGYIEIWSLETNQLVGSIIRVSNELGKNCWREGRWEEQVISG